MPWLRQFKQSTLAGTVLILLLFLAIAVYCAKTAGLLQTYSPLDDSYMFIRYAKHVLEGQGVAWNAGDPPTYGLSSLAYFALVISAQAILPVNPSLLLQLLSVGSTIAFVLLMTYAARQACHSHLMLHTALIPLLIVAFIFTSDSFLYHSLSGMETTLAMASNSLLILLVLRLLAAPSIVSCIAVALSALWCFETRPDTGLYAVLFPALAIMLMGPPEQRQKLLGWSLGVLVAMLVIDAAIKKIYFGVPFPLAFYVKRMGFYEGYTGHHNWNTVAYMILFLQQIMPFLVLALFTMQRKHLRILFVCLFPAILHFNYLLTVEQITANHARYYFPAVPFMILPAMVMLDDFITDRIEGVSWPTSRMIKSVMASALLVAMLSPLFGDRVAGFYRIYVLERADKKFQQPVLGTALAPKLPWSQSLLAMSHVIANLPNGTVVALSEVGYIGALSPHIRIIDSAGLNDTEMVRKHISAGHVIAQRPDLIWLPHSDYTALVAAILRNPDFKREYTYYPGAFAYGIAIRKNSPYRKDITSSLSQEWSRTYPRVPSPF